MKGRLLAFFTLVTLAAPAICAATPPRPGPYVSAFAGLTIPYDVTATSRSGARHDDIEFDPSVNVGATGGYDTGIVRFEGELSYKNAEMARISNHTDVDGRIGVLAMMGNAFLDLHNPSPITPYFGGGVGFAALHQNKTFSAEGRVYRADDDAVFAYQFGGGLEIALNNRFSLDFGYRYFRTSKATFNNGSFDEDQMRFESHNLAGAFRMKF